MTDEELDQYVKGQVQSVLALPYIDDLRRVLLPPDPLMKLNTEVRLKIEGKNRMIRGKLIRQLEMEINNAEK
jgi:hypothetical protein